MTNEEFDWEQWMSPETFAGVQYGPHYGPVPPLAMRRERAREKLLNWRGYHAPRTIIIHPDHYAWLANELKETGYVK